MLRGMTTNADPTQAPYQVPAAPRPRSPWLGRVGLGIVVVALVAAIVAAIPIGGFLADSMYAAGYFTNPDIALLPDPVAREVGRRVSILVLLCGLGTTGWILAIVAAITCRGRNPGMTGIIVGALSPIVIGGVLIASVVMHLPNAG